MTRAGPAAAAATTTTATAGAPLMTVNYGPMPQFDETNSTSVVYDKMIL